MAPYSSAGAKNEIADDGHFLQKKTPSVHFTKKLLLFLDCSGTYIYLEKYIYLPPPPLLPVLTGTRAIEL